jgi:acyl-CoA thioester hydrolase
LIHTRTFRVRHYECDAYGHVNHANYLRYMQEAAIEASGAAGYDEARYEEIGHFWLIRETEIEYLRPLRYNDVVEVKTYVVDFRRVRSRRAYEFSLAGSGESVAHARTDWAFLDRATLRPAAIPEEMKIAFFPEGTPNVMPPRERFPEPPPPPPSVFHQHRRAEWRDLDQAGHVNNAVYLNYIEDCGVGMVAAFGWPIPRMTAEGFAVVARQHRIEYKQPALLDDELEVTTWLSEVQDSTAIRHSTVTRVCDKALLMQARTVHVWVDLETGKPKPIPEPFLRDLAPTLALVQPVEGSGHEQDSQTAI